jgi:hypothetical protein
MNIKINSGTKVINHKLANKNSLYYRDFLPRELQESGKTNPSLDELIVIEFNIPTDLPNYAIKQNIIGCWNSECNTVLYATHNKSFNQSIISEEIRKINQKQKIDMTILLGDNLYDRPDFIVPKITETPDVDISAVSKKRPMFFKSIIQNGFECFKNVVESSHPFFLILGNHDSDKEVMKYEIGLTYSNEHTRIVGDHLECHTQWIMPEEFYVLKIGSWHFLMVNSNLFSKDMEADDIIVSNYQLKLFELYLESLELTTTKNVIVCLHEPFYAIGHKYTKRIIENRGFEFYEKIILRYANKIHTVFAADEHDTQELYDIANDINHVVASGAPYSGGDLLFDIFNEEYKSSFDVNFMVKQMYNSNVLPINIITKKSLETKFNVICDSSIRNLENNQINGFSKSILKIKEIEDTFEDKKDKKNKKDKKKLPSHQVVETTKNSLTNNLITGSENSVEPIVEKTPEQIQKESLKENIVFECKRFNELYGTIVRHLEINNKFNTTLTKNYNYERESTLLLLINDIKDKVNNYNRL